MAGPPSRGRPLRGVGSSAISAAFDSAVAFDFDGVQISTMHIVQSAFFDTAQIDVLKGPQSLYFGKSASAGVLSIKSRNPTDTFEAGGKLSYEFEEKGYIAEAYMSGPINDKLGFRLAGRFNEVEELYSNAAPVVNKERSVSNTNVRGTLQWDPTSNFSASLSANYVKLENDGAIGDVVMDCGPNGVADPLVVLRGAVVLEPGYSCNADTPFLSDAASPLVVQAPAGNAGANNGVPYGENTSYLNVLKMDRM